MKIFICLECKIKVFHLFRYCHRFKYFSLFPADLSAITIEKFQEARKEGKIRFIGFSAHSVEAAMALLDRYDFDTILFPVHFATWHAGNFGFQVLARAHEKKMGILALKAMAKGPWPHGADKTRYPKCWYEPLSASLKPLKSPGLFGFAIRAFRFWICNPSYTLPMFTDKGLQQLTQWEEEATSLLPKNTNTGWQLLVCMV
jgi:aryl-alcohol dehydrogenase-like predicted oxidoreductase